jgi:hypothetical protein
MSRGCVARFMGSAIAITFLLGLALIDIGEAFRVYEIAHNSGVSSVVQHFRGDRVKLTALGPWGASGVVVRGWYLPLMMGLCLLGATLLALWLSIKAARRLACAGPNRSAVKSP